MENNKQKIEEKIMSEIKSGRLKLRSKYLFLAEKLGLGGAFALSIVLAVLFFNLALFYMKATDNLTYLSFGKNGFLAFLESFPYLLVVVFVIFICLAGYLIAKSGIAYKKPFSYLAIGLVIFVMLAGGVLALTDVSERIERHAYGEHPFGRVFKPFFEGGMEMRGRGAAGIIFDLGDEYLIIETPVGLQKVNLEDVSKDNLDQLEKGQFIVAIGERWDYDFYAKEIRIVSEDKLPMIDRGIHRQFSPYLISGPRPDGELQLPSIPSHLLQFDEKTRECVQKCFEQKRRPKKCFDECSR